MRRRLGTALLVAVMVGTLAGAAQADDPTPAPAPDLKATSDAQALALLGTGATLFASIHGVDIFNRPGPLTSAPTPYTFACAAACTVSAHARLTLTDTQGRSTTHAVPGVRVKLSPGEARLVSIQLTAAQKPLLRKPGRSSLVVTFVVSPPPR